MKHKNNNLRVIDFFCGAGGFSEGFRQQGFKIVKGVDYWGPAIATHNLNHGLNDDVKNVLDFWSEDTSDVEEIEKLEDVEVIVGSPSCTYFSMSNKCGRADKTDGIHLIETYLRVIAVKKHKNKSVLNAWYMENVPQARHYIQDRYTFEDLNLAQWAISSGYKKTDVALNIKGDILNAGDYGACQNRKRFIIGEWILTGEFLYPKITHKKHKTVNDVVGKMPSPVLPKNTKRVVDPNYEQVKIPVSRLTDHFYDSGVYRIDWERAEFAKTNHPFMGKMFFPDNKQKTSRTIMATISASTRESILYESEYMRQGDGQYRTPTIREAASLMGFPFVYQFSGGTESIKWRQIGNAVCPHQSAALAQVVRSKMGLSPVMEEDIEFSNSKYNKIINLNTFSERIFKAPTKRKKNARFRRHTFKSGNMTVDLMNYNPNDRNMVAKNWYVVIFSGTGEGYDIKVLNKKDKKNIESILKESLYCFAMYESELKKISFDKSILQDVYENDLLLDNDSNPVLLVKRLGKIIQSFEGHDKTIENINITRRQSMPIGQLMSAYGLMSIIY
ncbi:MAG: DNA cytosine methyltransferase [Candidatus Spechtbacteria bacterium SB0662_bin_43]|uniref:DNA (cytosine-5-)-methyltransferase n=1 Tax=Candidatus Spechtbacteria bacterium SB0662_bin_43 TaxID=2604897 RepID=A0A845D867_9BACT|nr:DNA cytosine methyltransferase [Candidatus Spechtbacteria bacterium SB0662_bin_43]